jgi:hypothetical protein
MIKDCGMLLVSNYVPFDNMPYCKQDYLKRSGLICGVCGEYIETGTCSLTALILIFILDISNIESACVCA